MTNEYYLDATKKSIVSYYFYLYFNSEPFDKFINDLNQILSKTKTFQRISNYVFDEVENKKHDFSTVLRNISFFAIVLKTNMDKPER